METAVSHHPAASRALRAFAPVMLALGALFAASEYSGVWETKAEWQRILESFAFVPLQLGSALALVVASRRQALPDGVRRGLRFCAAAFGFAAAGSLAWGAVYVVTGAQPDSISWIDVLYVVFYPLLTLGVLALPTVEGTRRGGAHVADLAILSLAFGGLTVFALSVDPALRSASLALQLLVLAMSAGQLLALFVFNGAIERARRIPSGRATMMLSVALGIAVVGDIVYQILAAVGYTGPNHNITIAILANLMVYLAARAFHDDALPAPGADTPMMPYSPLPVVAVMAVALLLVWMATTGRAPLTWSLFIALAVLNVLLIVRDLHANRHAAIAMREVEQSRAERRIEALVRHASDAILLIDPEGRLAFASAPADVIFGTPLAGREGIPVRDLIPAEARADWDRFRASLRLRPGQPGTHRWQRADAHGQMRVVECIGLDLLDEPAVGGTVLNLRDTTERHALEERLQQAQKLEVAGRLAGGVAHDFNNVLTTVIAGTELAQLSLADDHPLQHDLRSIGAAAQRGAALTRRLLAFVRQQPMPAQRLDLAATLRELEPLLGKLVGGSHPVSLQVEPSLGMVEVDRTELEHIIYNLVANARDAMPSGGIITIAAATRTIDATPSDETHLVPPAPGTYATVTVRDTGVGMDAEVRRRMFDPFFTRKGGGIGTGLGLIGVRPLVEGAKGGLQVASEPGRGTAVTILLPVIEGGSHAPRPERSSPSPMSRRRLLLVEDEAPVREQVARLIDALGYEVEVTASAAEARQVLARPGANVHGVVSDVLMPGENGIEFARWLRDAHGALPILLISGHTGTAVDRAGLALDEFPLLQKPFGRAELGDRLAELLDRSVGC